jgi:hypothetical protein
MFKLFRQADVSSVTALHSLRFLNAGNRPFGQADFVLVGPKGIIVVEVKGGSIRKNVDGTWTIGGEDSKNYTTHESPIEQAARNSMAIRDWLTPRVEYSTKDIPVGHAIVMPYQTGAVKGMDVVAQIAGDRNDCKDQLAFARWVASCFDYWWRKKGFSIDALSAKEVDTTVELLRGKFEVEPSLDAKTAAIFDRQDTLSAEQLRVVDAAERMPRVVVTGGAGSGKSFVIRAIARRSVEQGEQVGILVPRIELKQLYTDIEALGCKVFGPFAKAESVETLLVDEGQDFCNELGLSLMDQSVTGGLISGRWRVFLDDNIQASLRGLWSLNYYNELGVYASGFGLELKDNYRNTDKIVANILLAVPAKIGRAQVSAGEDCLQYEDGADRVAKVLSRMHDRGARWDQLCVIVIGSISEIQDVLSEHSIKWTSQFLGSDVLVTTPETVQGLEFPHVVVFIDAPYDELTAARFYVAASRARATLTIVDPGGIYSRLVEENLE